AEPAHLALGDALLVGDALDDPTGLLAVAVLRNGYVTCRLGGLGTFDRPEAPAVTCRAAHHRAPGSRRAREAAPVLQDVGLLAVLALLYHADMGLLLVGRHQAGS